MRWLWVFLGGGIGAVLRFGVGAWVQSKSGPVFPWGTLAVNLAGCLAIGVLAALAEHTHAVPPGARLFLVVGLLGGFTTFSAFGLETWVLLETGAVAAAGGYVLASVLGGVLLVLLAYLTTRELV